MYGRSAGRHRDGSVGFLVVLEHRDQRAPDREPRSVQGVAELRLPAARRSVA